MVAGHASSRSHSVAGEHADLAALEWEPLLALVAGFAASPVGRNAILALQPSTDEEWIGRQHQLTGEVRLLIQEQISDRAGRLVRPHATGREGADCRRRARSSGVAGSGAARERRGLVAGAAARAAGAAGGQAAGALRAFIGADSDESCGRSPQSIERKIQPDGSLADDASPELSRIRREQERQQRIIEESLRAALRKLSSEGSTQDDVITIRGERFVIPVRAELKRRVTGVIHGASSSGQTVYVEPLETIEQNNELVRLIEEEQAEIHRIFVALTRQVAGYAHSLVEGARVLALVDSLLARARFARDYDCVEPTFGQDRLLIEGARHPLLEKRLRATGGQIVPLVLELTADERQLIISGPNTGGKSVALKTTALLAMMAQAGIPVPARAGELSRLHGVPGRHWRRAVDRGRAFHVFRAHYQSRPALAPGRCAFVGAARRAGLLDRSRRGRGAGCGRGAPLSSRPARGRLISTHHTSLKVYAANTPGVRNAAAGVDERTLVPNYQFHLGVPGASAGIQTAERLGLNATIIAAARERLGSQQADIARFLDKLHSELAELDQDKKKTREQQYALNQERKKLEREGDAEVRNRVRELEAKLASLLQGIRVSDARERARCRGPRGAAKAHQRSRAAHPAAAARVPGEL